MGIKILNNSLTELLILHWLIIFNTMQKLIIFNICTIQETILRTETVHLQLR